MKNAKKQTGIWLDVRNAYIINVHNGEDEYEVIRSDIDEFNPKGGYGSSIPYDQQDAMSEQRYLRRKNQQMSEYFDKIIKKVNDSDEIVIMGPAETRLFLEKAIKAQPQLNTEILDNISMDSLTENQIRAAVRDFFSEKS